MDKYKKYEALKTQLKNQGVAVGGYKEINFGLQFDVTLESNTSKVRVYESKKKGVTVDLSQLRSEKIKELMMGVGVETKEEKRSSEKKVSTVQSSEYQSDDLEKSLIGVDESGKGDYFGPLVIAGVYADKKIKIELMKIGVADSKKLTDIKILKLADEIKKCCPYEVICMNNPTYNRLYAKINNLNHLLAWGHAKIIEKLWEATRSEVALSDQFAKNSLIRSNLDRKNVKIRLEERPRAEENVVVAAASILARAEFVKHMKEMEEVYGQAFPKGAGPQTITAGKNYIKKYSLEGLNQVAKLHFKTTSEL